MNGVTIGGIKYMYLQSDDNQIQAKKGATGVSIAKAGKCKLVAYIWCMWVITYDQSLGLHFNRIFYTELSNLEYWSHNQITSNSQWSQK